MLMLAFESSAKAASVALCRDGSLIGQTVQCSGLTHSRTLLPIAEDLLHNTEHSMREVDCFAVACGPGSFTGIRIGVSTVKGLSWAADKPCIGVSTLAAMAWNGVAAGGLVCAVMDARRSEVYNALFRIVEGRPVRLCEDGAILADNYLQECGLRSRLAPEPLQLQNAWGVAMEADGKPVGASQDLLPTYLRLSQAERERQARLRKNTGR